MDQLTSILKAVRLHEDDLILACPYGSRVYGTVDEQSDYDFIVVHTGDKEKDGVQYDTFCFETNKPLTVHSYHLDSWTKHLADHKIFALECHSLMPLDCVPFEYDEALLRKEISSVASNSWVKCKKKLTVEEDARRVGIKSLFHAFRIPMFGIQIAKHGKIVDFHEARDLWVCEFEPYLHNNTPWDEIREIYQPKRNALMSEFRKHAKKE